MKRWGKAALLAAVLICADNGLHGENLNGLLYTARDGAVTITGYAGPGGDLRIPKNIGGAPVTKIAPGAFQASAGLRSVSIPPPVAEIGEYAFALCADLEAVTVPLSVTRIGHGAFAACASLTDIAVDHGNRAYTGVDGVVFTKDEKILLAYPAGKKGTSYTIPLMVTAIKEAAFAGCVNLRDLGMPPSVTKIGEYAFSACAGLRSVPIPPSVTVIKKSAFAGCVNLRDLVLPPSVTKIGKYAFAGCAGLTEVVIPRSVMSIGDEAFTECPELKTVTLSRRTRLGEGAFPERARLVYRDEADG